MRSELERHGGVIENCEAVPETEADYEMPKPIMPEPETAPAPASPVVEGWPFTAEQAKEEELDFTDNIAFENKIVGGSIPKEFVPSVEYGVRQTASSGVKFGFPLINVKITLVDGSYHAVDSSQGTMR